MRAEVGLLSKSITIQGDASSDLQGYGGHFMIHQNGKAFVNNIELYRMGQKSTEARYPFHWHLLQDNGAGQFIKNSSIHKSFNRAIVIHGTESTLVENNFCYDHIGHGVFLEDGSERFNTIKGNVVLLTKRPAVGEELTPSDNEIDVVQNRTPSSYWITNPNNTFENNVAAGTQGTGFWFAMPRTPMKLSGSIPRFSALEPYKELLGKFAGNKAHSCASGFDIFDQLNPNHSLDINGPWQRTDIRVMDNCTWYACDLAVYGGIGGGRTFTKDVVFRNNVFMDNKTAVMHANYSLTEESVFVANSGEDVFTGTRQLNRGYDGSCTIKNCHLVGWQEPNANYLQNTGGADKHVNYRVSGLTMDHLGPPRMQLPDYSIVPKGGVGANDAAHPRFWSYVHWDMDGSLGGKANTSIITNHPLGRDGSEVRYANWTNIYRTDRRFAYMSIFSPGVPKMTLVRTKAGTPKAGQYFINDDGPNGFLGDRIQFPVIVNDGFLYTMQFESLGTGKNVNINLKDDYTPGDKILFKIKDFGRLGGVNVSNAIRYNTLTEVQNNNNSGFAIVAGDLYLKMVVGTNPDMACNITWTTNITLPILDTDADGTSDYQESVDGTDPIPNDPIVLNPVLALPTLKTAWEFNTNGNAESWSMAKGLTGSVAGGANALQITAADPNFISDVNLNIPTSTYKYLRFRVKSDKAGNLQIYWGRTGAQSFSQLRFKSVAIQSSGANFKEYVVDMSDSPEWNNNIYQLRLDPEFVVGANVAFDLISFEKTNELDCNGTWGGTAVLDNCAACVGGTTGITACIKTVWEYNTNTDLESWKIGNNLTGNVFAGAVNLQINGTDPQFNSPINLGVPSATFKFLHFRIKTPSQGSIQVFWGRDGATGISSARLKTIPIVANNTVFVDYYLDMSTSITEWTGNIYQLRIDTEFPAGTSIAIDRISFEKTKPTVTSTEATLELEQLNIFPNPSKNGVFEFSKDTEWEVFSVTGQKIEEGKGKYLNISNHNKGIYFVKSAGAYFKILFE